MTATPSGELLPTKHPLHDYGYEPGDYIAWCHNCKFEFEGDKRAITCKDCAEKLKAKTRRAPTPPAPVVPEAINFLQVVPQTHAEKRTMYAGFSKDVLIEMLINANTLLDGIKPKLESYSTTDLKIESLTPKATPKEST